MVSTKVNTTSNAGQLILGQRKISCISLWKFCQKPVFGFTYFSFVVNDLHNIFYVEILCLLMVNSYCKKSILELNNYVIKFQFVLPA